MKLAQLHARIADIRRNCLHQLTTSITRRFRTIVIEDLNVKGMLKNHTLARAIADMVSQSCWKSLALASASRYAGSPHAARIPCYAPSSKLCSVCGYKLEALQLGIRNWTCPGCNVIHDRDVNAAINLKNSAASSTAMACGEEGAGFANTRKAKTSPMKQESNCKKF